ncbi:putative tRNA pseudouridine(38-40) synthase [Lupinus albus]|uniref:tRNA pseudouridine synthase n=1 Tax=Lupinus albus TaxID=3870 RepID=A0A6A4QJB8_LUPAL|nr:putative tRNA pseudouridine(38-40) synthase [Lupinus albus]
MLISFLRRMSIAKHHIPSFGFGFHTTTSIHKHTPNNHLFFSSSSSSSMELEMEQVGHVHYNHTLPSKHPRWNARESFEFMSLKPWQPINHFYLNLVHSYSSLSILFPSQALLNDNDTAIPPPLSDKIELESVAPKNRTGRWERATFKIVLSYHGGSFDGWQKQPGLNTVQSVVEASLGKFVDERKTQLLKDRGLPIEGCATVAGRTDKGVTGLQQVCSFYTWDKDVNPRDIEDAINHAAPGKLRVISVSKVSRAFHPNFSAKWRHYLYIFPLISKGYRDQSNGNGDVSDYNGILDSACKEELESEKKSYMFSVRKVNRLLRELEGKLLSYKMFARDTKASRNEGPPTECFLYHARAMEARLPITDFGEETSVMCVELVANRFLRKMVRVLVATSIREAAAGAEDDALLKLMDATCRRATAPPAPPDGLCLVDVGYAEFDPKKCFIQEE